MKYLLNVIQSEKMHSGSKAQDDVRLFLKSKGVLNIYIDGEMGRFEKYIFLNRLVQRKINSLTTSDELIFQYPIYMGRFANFVLKKRLLVFHGRKIAILHDIRTLRVNASRAEIKKEIQFLNIFDCVIAHSNQMVDWLIDNGYNGKAKVLGPFDYSNNFPFIKNELNNHSKTEVVFAGNLGKSNFLSKISPKNYQLNLFGINFKSDYKNSNTKYFGSFPPDILPRKIQGDFGLVWDGESPDKSDYYTKFNSPHKASFYLSMGIPIIVWSQSALADFVKREHCGLIIDKLDDLETISLKIDITEYEQLFKNAIKIGKKMRSGYFLSSALNK